MNSFATLRSAGLSAAALFTTLFVMGCAPGTSVPDQDDESVEESDPRALSGDTVYVVTRQDLRKCAYPMCGGVYVKAVNKTKTTCMDGSKQADCYVAELDVAALGLPEDQAVSVRGEATAGRVLLSAGFVALPQGGIPKLEVHKAFSARTANTASGTYYLVQSSGIQCIKAPCESMEGLKLNTSTVKPLTDINLSALGLTPDAEQQVLARIMQSSVMATGTIKSVKVQGGTVKRLDVSQLFDLVEPAQTLCLAADDCAAGSYCDTTQCLSNCAPGQVCPAACYGACVAGDPPAPAPGPDSCVDACGGASSDGSCYCDAACEFYGDCCKDFSAACP
ncbi:MAG: DUF6748 domain-containing protein [Polyangiaceae bacterium]